MIKKGTYVEIEQVVLEICDRSQAIPEETKKTPLMSWLKGYLQEDANIGEVVEVRTTTGRLEKGVMTMEKPGYTHDFGEFVEELMFIGPQAKEILWGDKNE